MADKNRNRDQEVKLEDVMEVGSRVSWAAILAGAVMALAIMLVMGLLGTAIGLTSSDSVDRETLGIGAAVWAVVTMLIAWFVGGFITSQCVVGETKTESAVHGIIMWGAALAMLLWLAASGINFGVSTTMDVANVSANTDDAQWQRMARAAGVSEEQLDEWSAAAADPQNQAAAAEETQEAATHATWWTLAGTVLSMIAAIAGAIVGAGPTFRLLPVHVHHRHNETSRAMPGGA